MSLNVLKSMLSTGAIASVLLVSLACGGGGGGGSAGSSTSSTITSGSSNTFYVVNYVESAVNTVAVTGAHQSSFSIDTSVFKGQTSSAQDLVFAARASSTSTPPAMSIALQGGAVDPTVSGVFQAAVYGIGPTGAQVATGQVQIDFSTTPPTVTDEGTVTTEFNTLIKPTLAGAFDQTATEGKLTWGGNWQGRTNNNGDVILMSFEKMFLLAAKMNDAAAPHATSSVTGTTSFAGLLQIDSVSGSALGSWIGANNVTISYSPQNLTLVGGSGLDSNSVTRSTLALRGTGNSIIDISDGSGTLEQGFLAPRDFFVVLNHNSSARPTISLVIRP
jgi:hypothetical protein